MTDQKHYPMPALTENEREALIESCELEIDENPYSPHAQMAKITLAALTAELVAYTSEWALSDVFIGETSMMGKWNDVGDIPLYTVPPVPALKPVVLPVLPVPFGSATNYALKYRELFVSAIRAAGYEVKDAE